MEVKAYAKINLCLDVVKRREDGYHEMRMIMVPLDVYDTITIEFAQQDRCTFDPEILCADSSNTVVKALRLMKETYGITKHFHVHVKKQIPMEAGLAGGSADAAALMRGLAKLLQLDCDREELAQLGKQIGADVPFCVYNQCALVEGIGEKITPFTMQGNFYVLLVKPKQGVSTKQAFSMLDFTSCVHPDTLRCMQALRTGDIDAFYQESKNTLEQSAFQLVPEIQKIKTALQDFGFPFVLMSGSGSTVFALSEDPQIVAQAYEVFQSQYPFVLQTKVREKECKILHKN